VISVAQSISNLRWRLKELHERANASDGVKAGSSEADALLRAALLNFSAYRDADAVTLLGMFASAEELHQQFRAVVPEIGGITWEH
jgi:hypothetical protein